MKDSEIKKILVENDEEFKKIYEEHQNYENQLKDFQDKHFLTSEEELEVKKIKKKKLFLKDKMQQIINEYRKESKN